MGAGSIAQLKNQTKSNIINHRWTLSVLETKKYRQPVRVRLDFSRGQRPTRRASEGTKWYKNGKNLMRERDDSRKQHVGSVEEIWELAENFVNGTCVESISTLVYCYSFVYSTVYVKLFAKNVYKKQLVRWVRKEFTVMRCLLIRSEHCWILSFYA